MANKIDKTKKEIDAIFSKRDTDLCQMEKDLEDTRADIAAQKKARDDAAGYDPEGYVAAEKKLEADELDEKMTAARIEKTKAAPLFTEAQYKKIRSALFEEMDNLTEATKKRLEKMTLDMEADGQTLRNEWTETEDILKRVFREMSRDGKRKPGESADTYTGAIMTVALSKKAAEFYHLNKELHTGE